MSGHQLRAVTRRGIRGPHWRRFVIFVILYGTVLLTNKQFEGHAAPAGEQRPPSQR